MAHYTQPGEIGTWSQWLDSAGVLGTPGSWNFQPNVDYSLVDTSMAIHLSNPPPGQALYFNGFQGLPSASNSLGSTLPQLESTTGDMDRRWTVDPSLLPLTSRQVTRSGSVPCRTPGATPRDEEVPPREMPSKDSLDSSLSRHQIETRPQKKLYSLPLPACLHSPVSSDKMELPTYPPQPRALLSRTSLPFPPPTPAASQAGTQPGIPSSLKRCLPLGSSETARQSFPTPKSLKTEPGQSPRSSTGNRPPCDSYEDGLGFGNESQRDENEDGNQPSELSSLSDKTEYMYEILDDTPETEIPELDPDHLFALHTDALVEDAVAKFTQRVNRDSRHNTTPHVKNDSNATNHASVVQSSPPNHTARLRCPYFASNPTRHRSCLANADITSILSLKKHISRAHSRPTYCPVCFATFQDASLRDRHIRARCCSRGHPRSNPGSFEGVSSDQISRLARIRRDLSEEEQWGKISKVVLPSSSSSSSSSSIGTGAQDRRRRRRRRRRQTSIRLGDDNGVEAAVVKAREFWDQEGKTIVSGFLKERILEMRDYNVPDEERSLAAMLAIVGRQVVEVVVACFS
ncbi:hypothetical protein MKZ38_007258 [Zalerion maritima]|uniref:Uncharacterized protein n=1 Tax=Zalerion maritima TaxID=339359 RepID=A0AAD5RUY2_9PEZI|nr:hypothetical protein MKZ38_007258 [Zalerion maritima]